MVQRGQGIRRRRRVSLWVSAVVLAQLMLALPLLVARSDDDDSSRVETASAQSTTTVGEESVLTTLVAGEPPSSVAVPSTTILVTTTTVVRATTTTAAPRCRNSEDARCGPFRWDPAPGPNEPAQASMTYSPSSPRAGQPVQFTLRGTDPDAAGVRLWTGPCVTPNPGGSCPNTPTATACDPHGPWTPPAEQALNRQEVWTLNFPDPGTYHVTFTMQTQSHSCPKVDPYGSGASTAVDVVVEPAE